MSRYGLWTWASDSIPVTNLINNYLKFYVIYHFKTFDESMSKASSLHRVYVMLRSFKICWQINESKFIIS